MPFASAYGLPCLAVHSDIGSRQIKKLGQGDHLLSLPKKALILYKNIWILSNKFEFTKQEIKTRGEPVKNFDSVICGFLFGVFVVVMLLKVTGRL